MNFEFLIPRRPLSQQANNRHLKYWREAVREEAAKAWTGAEPADGDLQLLIVCLCGAVNPPDADNVIKPIQDALVGLIFADDLQVVGVECHRRFLTDRIDPARVPDLLAAGIAAGHECVYVRVTDARPLEEYL